MSISNRDKNNNRKGWLGILQQVGQQSSVNQIRGAQVAGATGAGVPQHVTNVSTSVATASPGQTSTVTVSFRRNPSDANFSGVDVFVKGYQGSSTPTRLCERNRQPASVHP